MADVRSPPPAPTIFDRALHRVRVKRALRAPGDDFLLTRAAEDLVDRLAPVQRSFKTILDCGTVRPTLATTLAQALPDARITRLGPDAAGLGDWDAVLGDEEKLPFAPETFDLAVSALTLQTLNDLPGALVQMRRALKPDGLFLGCLFGGQTLQELRAVLTEAEIEATSGASPRVAPFADLRDLGGLLQRAGFALPVTDTDRLTVRYDTLFALIGDLRAMGLTNVLVDRSRRPTSRTVMLRAAALYAARFADADGRLRATFEIVWLSGWAPHASQQKPLRPGSATTRLADALAAMRPVGDTEPQ